LIEPARPSQKISVSQQPPHPHGLWLQPGVLYVPDYLDTPRQCALLVSIRERLEEAPLYTAHMPKSGLPLSVRMSNFGGLGWYSDRSKGYRYETLHPDTGRPWPSLPPLAEQAWWDLADDPQPPQACLLNHYATGTKMGLHQDRDEDALCAPVVSLSLGDTCVFRFGGISRRDKTKTIKLHSGDAIVLCGESRLAFHGVDRILSGSSTLLEEGGRFNLTLRRVRNL
jgi:alkylated DNA repair protein (DNA oxidative demethylase)